MIKDMRFPNTYFNFFFIFLGMENYLRSAVREVEINVF